jgi:flagellin
MSLRINQNIGALNVHRNLMNTDNAMSKSVNRLSSGFRINGGADDPAGLVISEYLRAQVDGLGQAIANSNDAINLIKTAEGALAEVNNLLKSMRTLAVHASNTGVNSAEALAADQADIQSAIASLNRIASTTMFGDKRLLDGTSGITGTSTNGLITVTGCTAMTKAGTYSVDITAVATRASVTSSARQVQQITAGAAADNSKNTITGADFGQLQFAGDAVGGSTYNIRIYANETVQDVVDRINGDAFLSQKITAGLDAAGKLTFTTNTLNATDGSLTVQAINGQGASGTAAIVEAFTGVTAASAMTSAAVTASGSSRLAKAETLTITDVTNGNRSTSVSLQAGDSLDTVVRKINSAVIAAGVRVQASLEENAKIVFTNTAYGSAANARVTITSSITEAASTANLGIGFVDERRGLHRRWPDPDRQLRQRQHRRPAAPGGRQLHRHRRCQRDGQPGLAHLPGGRQRRPAHLAVADQRRRRPARHHRDRAGDGRAQRRGHRHYHPGWRARCHQDPRRGDPADLHSACPTGRLPAQRAGKQHQLAGDCQGEPAGLRKLDP